MMRLNYFYSLCIYYYIIYVHIFFLNFNYYLHTRSYSKNTYYILQVKQTQTLTFVMSVNNKNSTIMIIGKPLQ